MVALRTSKRLKINGQTIDSGVLIEHTQLGKQWRALLAAGKVRHDGVSIKDGFTDGQRFKLVPSRNK